MKCSRCNYELDFFDTSCPSCKKAAIASPDAARAGTSAQPAGSQKTAATPALPHSAVELRRYLTKYWLQGALIGAGIGFVGALPLGLSLNIYRLAALAVRFKSQKSGIFYSARMTVGDGPLLVMTALAVLALAIAMGWWIGRHWEETASAHPQTKGSLTTQAKLFGMLVAGTAACFFIAWQHLHTTIIATPHWIRRPEYYYWSSAPIQVPNELLVVRSLTVTLMLIGAFVGLLVGRMVGKQQYEQARLRGFRVVRPTAQATTRRPGGSVAVNWGIWLVGAISLIMPCVGVLLYMAYSKDEDERATAAAIGVALALVMIGMRTFFRLSGQPVVD